MMKRYIFLLFVFCSFHNINAQRIHQAWDDILQLYVTDEGWVKYKDFSKTDKNKLDTYIKAMGRLEPNSDWTAKEEMAYWINVYNAVTVQLILKNYPVKSIQDLHPFFKIPGVYTVWHKTYFKTNSDKYSLNDIEHEILRTMNDPRIHFAINCASKSCPKLRNKAFEADKLDVQLDEQAKLFVNTSFYNEIEKNQLKLSKIFSWFKSDFTKEGSLISYLNRYAKVKINSEAEISYKDYNWNLNE